MPDLQADFDRVFAALEEWGFLAPDPASQAKLRRLLSQIEASMPDASPDVPVDAPLSDLAIVCAPYQCCAGCPCDGHAADCPTESSR